MEKYNKKYKIESLIFRVFLKHVKFNKMYAIFRLSVNHNGFPQDIIHTIASKGDSVYYDMISRMKVLGSPYVSARNLLDIYHIMGNGMDMKVENTPKYQMTLMNIINGLIHSCLEYGVRDENHQILGKIGEDVFTEVCKTIFGEDFTDKTAELMSPEQIEMMEKMGRMMPPTVGRDREHLHKEFIEWLKLHKSMMDSITNAQASCYDNNERRWRRTEPEPTYFDWAFDDLDWT